MKIPEIMMKLGDNWQPLLGHCCHNQKQMEEYIKALDPNGEVFKLVDLSIENEVKIDPQTNKKKM